VVCAWLGNSQRIATKHYLQVSVADCDQAAGGGAESGAQAAQNPAPHVAAENCTVLQEATQAPDNQGLVQSIANPCNTVQ
jgi:hypothetical protein